MIVLQTIAVAFAMFSAVPVPQFDWNEKNMRYSLCAFPLVGVLCGVLWCVCASLPLPAMVRAAGFCLIPVWVTGGIHLDGYADTCDALCSYGDTQKKLDILKDPHCGAFAVIRLCSYFVAYFALCCCVQFTPQVGAVWLLALVLERACSGYAVAAFPLAKNTGLAHTFATAADRTTVRRVLGCLSIVLAVALFALGGGVLVLAAGVCPVALPPCGGQAVWRYYRGPGRVVFAKSGTVYAGGPCVLPVEGVFVTCCLLPARCTAASVPLPNPLAGGRFTRCRPLPPMPKACPPLRTSLPNMT